MKDQNPVLSDESKAIFNEGIDLALWRWPVFQKVVESEWGCRDSRQKVGQFQSEIFSWFTLSKEPLYIRDLEDTIDDAFLSLFNADVGDDILEEIAGKLMIMHEECLEMNFTSIEALRELNKQRVPVSHVTKMTDSDDDDDDDDDDEDETMDEGPRCFSNSEDMIVDKPTPGPSVEAEDGWEVVGRNRSRGRRN